MIKKKPTFIPQIREKIEIEETLMGLLKEKFILMRIKSEIRSSMHFDIAVGNHEGVESKVTKLKDVENYLVYLTGRIDELSSDKPSQKLQTL